MTRVDRQEVRAPCAACQALATQRVDHIAAPASSTAGSVSASEPRAHCPPLRLQVSQLSFENVARRLVGLIGSSVSLTFLRRSPVSCGVAGRPCCARLLWWLRDCSMNTVSKMLFSDGVAQSSPTMTAPTYSIPSTWSAGTTRPPAPAAAAQQCGAAGEPHACDLWFWYDRKTESRAAARLRFCTCWSSPQCRECACGSGVFVKSLRKPPRRPPLNCVAGRP